MTFRLRTSSFRAVRAAKDLVRASTAHIVEGMFSPNNSDDDSFMCMYQNSQMFGSGVSLDSVDHYFSISPFATSVNHKFLETRFSSDLDLTNIESVYDHQHRNNLFLFAHTLYKTTPNYHHLTLDILDAAENPNIDISFFFDIVIPLFFCDPKDADGYILAMEFYLERI